MRRLLALAAVAALSGCVKFDSGGIYACDPETGKDCLVCDAGSGWCQDYAPKKLGATTLLSMSGSSPDAVWAVGVGGKALLWNGSRWVDKSPPTAVDLNSVLARASNDVWAVGADATWAHWDGNAWHVETIAPFTTPFARTIFSLFSVGGVNNTEHDVVYAGDSGGAILKWNGSAWDLLYDTPDTVAWWGISTAAGDGSTHFVGEVNKKSLDNGDPNPDYGKARYVRVDSSDAVTDSGLPVPTIDHPLRGVAAAASDDATAAGQDGVFHWDGAALGNVFAPTGAGLWAICAVAADDLWAVGDNGRVAHYTTDLGWKNVTQPFTSPILYGLYCSPTEIMAAAEDGTVLRYLR